MTAQKPEVHVCTGTQPTLRRLTTLGRWMRDMLRTKKTLLVKSAVLYPLEQYLSCPECKSKVQPIDSICGQCTKCGVVKLSKCPSNMLAKVKLEDDQGKCHFATMFTSVILSIIENDEGNVSTKPLQSSHMVFTINNRDIHHSGVKGGEQPGAGKQCYCCCHGHRRQSVQDMARGPYCEHF